MAFIEVDGKTVSTYEKPEHREREQEMRRELAGATGLSVRAPTTRDLKLWKGFPPFDGRIYGPAVFNRAVQPCSGILEFKDRSDYAPIAKGKTVFLCARKARRLVGLGIDEDVPVVFIVRDRDGLFYTSVTFSDIEKWVEVAQPRADRPETEDSVFEIPNTDFEPVGYLRQYLRDSSRN